MSADILGPSVPGLNDALNIGFGQYPRMLIDFLKARKGGAVLTDCNPFFFPADPLADSAADDQGDQGDYVHIRIQQVRVYMRTLVRCPRSDLDVLPFIAAQRKEVSDYCAGKRS